jgi:hypothetical protein
MSNATVSNNNVSEDITVNTFSINEFPIIPAAEFNDSTSQYEAAKVRSDELVKFKSAVTGARTLLASGDSCTAVDMMIMITAQPPKGKLALQFYDEAGKLLQECMLICAGKLAKLGGYENARTMLQPYAQENERFKQELEKIIVRQNKEMEEKAQQKKTIMDDIKSDDRRWRRLGIGSSILGGLLLVMGVIAAFFGKVEAGVVSSISAILPSLVVALYYNRSDKIYSDRIKLIEKTIGEEQLDLEVMKKTVLANPKDKSQIVARKK